MLLASFFVVVAYFIHIILTISTAHFIYMNVIWLQFNVSAKCTKFSILQPPGRMVIMSITRTLTLSFSSRIFFRRLKCNWDSGVLKGGCHSNQPPPVSRSDHPIRLFHPSRSFILTLVCRLCCNIHFGVLGFWLSSFVCPLGQLLQTLNVIVDVIQLF